MTDDFLDASEAPLVETVGGKQVTLPLLTMDDLGAIGRAIQNRRKLKALDELPRGTDPETRARVSRYWNDQEPSIREIAQYVWTLKGAEHFVATSFAAGEKPATKDQRTAAEAEGKKLFARVVRDRGWLRASELAAQLSTLFDRVPDPNAGGGVVPAESTSGGLSSPSPDGPADAIPGE